MFIKLFLVFIFVPVMEIYVLLSVGSLIGLWPTIGLILAT
ncbi:MAG: FxsA family protein, partial [Desulfuromonadales bacterium]|nr:FxsA family protein [Desulfuromonadales bacterium]